MQRVFRGSSRQTGERARETGQGYKRREEGKNERTKEGEERE